MVKSFIKIEPKNQVLLLGLVGLDAETEPHGKARSVQAQRDDTLCLSKGLNS